MQLIFFLLTRSMLERPPKDDMERWTTIAWAIWRARNKFCFEDFQPRLEAILRKVTSFLHEYQTLVANQWTHELFEGMGVMMIFFFLFFSLSWVSGQSVQPQSTSVRPLPYAFILLSHYFNSNSTFPIKKFIYIKL